MIARDTVARDDPLRVFLALRLPETALDSLARWQQEQLSGGRIVPREQLHLTLAFLGATPRCALGEVYTALERAASVAGPIELAPLGWRETRSVGMLVLAEDRAARELADDLAGRLEAFGRYRRERRPWLPHVTVLRFRERPRLAPMLPPMGTFVPSDAAAFLSRLHPSGARYEILHTTPLGGTTR